MRALEILLERRWILKSREKELYYQIKDELGTVKKFLMEKLGYQVIVNPYLVKVEKMPATPENWMGIQEFTRKIEYVFFCMILMFLVEKEAEEQFVLSELTEYIQGQYREEQIDWTVYQYRRHLIKVIKYCVNCGILNLNDGSEENFARDDTSEVLYENTGVSRYFMKNFTQDIMGYTTPEDQAEKESLSDSDTVKLKQREVEIKSQLEGLKKNITGKQRQDEEKKEQYKEVFSIALGDTVLLISKSTGIRESHRIVKFYEYPLTKEKNKVELANTRLSFEEVQRTAQELS